MSRGNEMDRRGFFGRLFGVGAATVTAAVVPESKPAPDVVKWPCAYCGHEHEIPIAIWPYARLHALCESCGLIQHYAAHLRRFDPKPLPGPAYGDHDRKDLLPTSDLIRTKPMPGVPFRDRTRVVQSTERDRRKWSIMESISRQITTRHRMKGKLPR